MRVFIICVAAFFLSTHIDAQIINPKKALEKKANKVIEKKIEEIPEDASKKEQQPEQQEERKEQEEQQRDQQAKTTPDSKSKIDTLPSLQAYSKFDFIPGEKVIFFDDFSQDNVGDFPALWNTNGSAEVVTTNLYTGKWMQFSTRNAIWTDAVLHLPENYTIEFDVVPIKGEEGGMAGYNFRLIQTINIKAFDHGSLPGKAGMLIGCEYFGRMSYRTYINGDEGNDLGLSGYKEGKQYYQVEGKKYHMSIWIQKSRVRIYQNETKLFDLPKAFPLSSVKLDRIRFEGGAAMISNVRVAVGTPDMRSKLITEGKLVSYGIYFDVNKSEVKPESYATLKEIAAVLNENPDVKIKIVGHTDADGADAANLELSKKRSSAVKDELAKSFGIDASRMETDGNGETKPVAPNDTPSNKALNRRVEFIKQ